MVCNGVFVWTDEPWRVVVIAQRKQPRSIDDFVASKRSAWEINTPDLSPATSCLEGPWVGPWDDNGVVAGGLACTGDDRSIDYDWNDVRTGLEGSVSFSTSSWAEAYRVWRQSGLATMTAP